MMREQGKNINAKWFFNTDPSTRKKQFQLIQIILLSNKKEIEID